MPAPPSSRAPWPVPSASESAGTEPTVIATATRAAPATGDTASMPAGWSPDALKALEAELVPLIGPVARTLVKRAAAKSLDAAGLIEILVNTLDGYEERQRFASRARVILEQTLMEGTAAYASAATIVARRQIPDADLLLAASRLTPYLGPIAKVLVKKAAARSRDVQALYAELAEHLTDPEEKRRFLKEAGIK